MCLNLFPDPKACHDPLEMPLDETSTSILLIALRSDRESLSTISDENSAFVASLLYGLGLEGHVGIVVPPF